MNRRVINQGMNKCYRAILLMLLVFAAPLYSYTQNFKADKLRNQLKNTTSDSTRIRLMKELSSLTSKGSDSALVFIQKELRKARETAEHEAEVEALLNLGVLSYNKLEYDAALAYFEKGVSLAGRYQLPQLQAYLLVKVGRWHRYRSKDSLLMQKTFNESLEISKSINHHEGVARVHAQLASFYARLGKVDLTMRNLEIAKINFLKSGDLKSIAHYYNEIGVSIWGYDRDFAFDIYLEGLEYSESSNLKVSVGKAYLSIGQLDKAIIYLEEAIAQYRESKEKRREGIAYTTLSEVYIKKRDYDKADLIADKCIRLLRPFDFRQQDGLLGAYRIKGDVMKQAGNYEAALAFYEKSLQLAKKTGIDLEQAKTNLTIGLLQLDFLDDTDAAITYCRQSLLNAQTAKVVNIQERACSCLHRVYKKNQSYYEALEYHEQYEILKDSLYSTRLRNDIDSLSRIFSVKTALKDEQLKSQRNETRFGAAIGTVLTLCLLSIFWLIYKTNMQIEAKNKELEHINKSLLATNRVKDNFIASINHQFRTPMNSILGFSELLLEMIPDNLKDIVHDMRFASLELKKMLKKMLQLAELQQGKVQLNYKSFDLECKLDLLVERYHRNYKKLADVKLSYEFTNEQLTKPIIGDKRILLEILTQLLDNAIEHTEQGAIKIHADVEHLDDTTTSIQFMVTDTGVGIPLDKQTSIFESFSELAEAKEKQFGGNGLGLAIASRMVALHGSKIELESTVDKGSQFFFTIVYALDKVAKPILKPS